MRGQSIFAVALFVLCVVSLASAGQNQQGGTIPVVTIAQPAPQAPAPPYAGPPQNYWQQYPPAAAYPNQAGVAPSQGTAQGGPTYPYPPYNNPYYDGTSARDVLNGTIEWLVGLPGQAIDSVSNFIDARFFPVQPATSGGQPQQAPPPAAPQTQAPLPSAGTYAPPAR